MAIHIRRRGFIITLGGTMAALPLAAGAQSKDRSRTIGILGVNALAYAPWVAAFADFQLPTILAPIAAPNPISVRRDRPRHITMFPGGGSLARARYPPNLAILIKY